MSELHLDVIQHRLKNRYKVDINTHVPHVPYLETIAGEAEAHHRHKKQTGGRGQFADVQLRIRPRARGEGFNFVDAIKGGVIPNQYIPAVEKGVREQLEKGVVSGNPVIDVEAEVFFGSYHAVDSSEQAFKTASATAFRKAFLAARPPGARADREPGGRRPAREVRRHLGRPVHPPRPHHRDGGAPRRDPGPSRRPSR